MRGVVGNAHTLAGLLVAPLIFVAALTGLFYAFSPTLEKLAYREELTATSQEPPKPLSEQVAAAQQAYPGLALKGVRAPEDPGDTTRVLLADPELGPAKKFSRAVFVDPGSLEVKGDLAQYGTSGSLPLRTWISHGHKELWLGQPGRVYSEMAATWLGPLAVTGVVLFLATWVRNRAPARRGSRRYAKEKHALLGLIVAPGMIFLCVSGLTWSLVAGHNIAQVRTHLDWMAPTPDTTPVTAVAAPGNLEAEPSASGAPGRDPLDTVLAVARAEGLTGFIDLTAPKDGEGAWKAVEARQPFRFATDAVAVDGATGAVVDSVPFSSWPLAARATSWIIQLHMGTLLGIYTQIALGAVALFIMAVVVLGYLAWWRRRRHHRVLPSLSPWAAVPAWGKAALLAACVAYGVIAPLFAASMVVLVALSFLMEAVRAVRGGEGRGERVRPRQDSNPRPMG